MTMTADNKFVWIGLCSVIALSLMPFIGVLSPRALSFLPGAFGLILISALAIQSKSWPRFEVRGYILVGVLLLLAAISSLWAIDADFALERTGKIALVLIPGLLLVSAIQNINAQHLEKISIVLPFFLIIGAALCCYELLSDGYLHHLFRGKEYGTEHFNPSVMNRSVLCISLCFFAALALIRHSMQTYAAKRRYIAIALLFMFIISCGFMLYLTQSQSSHLGMIIGGVLFLAFPYRCKASYIAIGFVTVVLLFATPWLSQWMFKSLPSIIEQYHWFQTGYAMHRMEIWDFISRYALDQPWTGFGIEATRHIKNFDSAMLYHPDPYILHPHNFAVQFWIEFGVIGVAVLSGFIGMLLWQISKLEPSRARIYLPTLYSVIAVASTGYGIWQSWWLGCFIMLLCLCIAVDKVVHQKQ